MLTIDSQDEVLFIICCVLLIISTLLKICSRFFVCLCKCKKNKQGEVDRYFKVGLKPVDSSSSSSSASNSTPPRDSTTLEEEVVQQQAEPFLEQFSDNK
jgi:hypothetical protein